MPLALKEKYRELCGGTLMAAGLLLPLVYIPAFNDFFYRTDGHYMPKAIFLVYMGLITAVTYGLGRLGEGRVRREGFLAGSGIAVLIMALWVFLSSVFSPYQELVWIGRGFRFEGFLTLMAYLTFAYVGARTLTIRQVEKLLNLMLAVSVLLALYGLIQYLGFEFLPRDMHREDRVRVAYATFGNRNFTGSYSVLMTCLFILQYIRLGLRRYLGGAMLLFSLLMASMTRGAWLGFLGASLLMLPVYRVHLHEKKKRIISVLLALILVFSLMSLDPYFRDRVLTFSGELDRLSSGDPEEMGMVGSNRGLIYLGTIPLLDDSLLLGSGPDTFGEVFDQDWYDSFTQKDDIIVDKAHNEYLNMWVTLGLPFLLAYLAFVGFHLRGVRKRDDALGYVLHYGVLGYLLQAVFNISVVTVAPLYWILLGMYGAVIRNLEKERSGVSESSIFRLQG